MTPEERADRERVRQMARERIAYHEAKAREEEERKERTLARRLASWRARRRG
jgi:hypothetical protein